MKDIYNKVADIIYKKHNKIAYEDAYEIAIEILKLPEMKAIPLGAGVKQKIADIEKEFKEDFIPYKPYYQSKKGIIYFSDLWTWFENKLSNFTV